MFLMKVFIRVRMIKRDKFPDMFGCLRWKKKTRCLSIFEERSMPLFGGFFSFEFSRLRVIRDEIPLHHIYHGS